MTEFHPLRHGRAALAPMAGVADSAFRELCRGYGAAFTVSEMVSCKGLAHGDIKSTALLSMGGAERPGAIQLFGSDPAAMARGARIAMMADPDWIDINMGCPTPKIVQNGCGSRLMTDPALCGRIVEAVVRAVPVPVTVKLRKGYSAAAANAVAVARVCESAGAAAITVHARTREQMYAPPADWDIIRQVKQSVSVPVIGNGDVSDATSAAAMLEQTGCDGVMIGRAALGAPWIFAAVQAWLAHGVVLPDPPLAVRLGVLRRQLERAASLKGEAVAMREGRKHAAWTMKGWRGAAAMRALACRLSTLADLERFCETALRMAQSADEL